MQSAPEPFRLQPPPPPRRANIRPEWWMQRVAGLTRDHREARALALEEAGRDRAAEAQEVLRRLDEARDAEEGWEPLFGPLSAARALHPADEGIGSSHHAEGVADILRRWDADMQASTGLARRLFRDAGETHTAWRLRVIAECHRRIESRWHSDRALGQRERFQRVAECGKDSRGWVACGTCGHHALELRKWCGNHYMCRGCRDRRKARVRRRFRLARVAALRAVEDLRLGPGQVSSDPIAERFFTFTVPRIPEELGGAERAVVVLREAWTKFNSRLRDWWKRRVSPERYARIRCVRVMEATAGKDGLGHVHLHAWMLSPFVRAEIVRWMWGQALLSAGYPADPENPNHWAEKSDIIEQLERAEDETALRGFRRRAARRLFWPRIYVRRVYTPTAGKGRTEGKAMVDAIGSADLKDLANELIKYLVKDIGGLGNSVLLPAETWAAIYRGLDGGRAITASVGFWVASSRLCPCCNDVHSWIITTQPAARQPQEARAPPSLYLVQPSDARAYIGHG